MKKKLKDLKAILEAYNRVLIAFSGGVDSTFLTHFAVRVLGRARVLAVLAVSPTYPKSELLLARRFLMKERIRFLIIRTHELENRMFRKNPVNRCYFCKRELFRALSRIAVSVGADAVLDGSNYDDRRDIRYGRRARTEFSVVSPLDKAALTKNEIRAFSRTMGLHTYDKPAMACLASRIPHGTPITGKLLRRVEKAERFIVSLGFSQVRVRDHDGLARIELAPSELKSLFRANYIDKIGSFLRKIGYRYVTVDLHGYRTGSLNMSFHTSRPKK